MCLVRREAFGKQLFAGQSISLFIIEVNVY